MTIIINYLIMRKTTMRIYYISLVCLAAFVQGVRAQSAQFGEMTGLEQFGTSSSGVYKPTTAEKQRIAWWRDAKFGMFMHWGLYSKIAGYWKGEKITGGEWALKLHKLPIEEYRALAKDFNPVKFNADEWVRLIKSAGMKYLVITAKHHDGFSMYGTKVTKYNIVDATPFHRDPMMELKRACDKYGIKFGLYYSHAQDWNEPDGYGNNWSWPGYKRNMDKYLDEKSIPQIREICEKYHPAIIWFDTAGEITDQRAKQISDMIRSIDPNILINSRIKLGSPMGLPYTDFNGSGDNEAFHEPQATPWELCGTMNRSWAFKKWDTNFRPVRELLYNLIDAVSKNGNYLLNVGPTDEGEITAPYATRLRQIGAWLKTNGEAIYGCGRTAFGNEFGAYQTVDGKRKFVASPLVWRCTTKPGKIYIHIFAWPEDGILQLPAIKGKIRKARLLAAHGLKVRFKQTAGTTLLTLPHEAPDSIASVVRIEM
jgi:alpha-L-fucosidase